MTDVPIEISCQDVAGLRQAGDSFLLVDCREPSEAEICRIEGAQLIPMGTITEKVDDLGPKDRRIVIHCHKGGRSYRVADWLRKQGFDNAQSMAGGIEEWAEKIEPAMAKY